MKQRNVNIVGIAMYLPDIIFNPLENPCIEKQTNKKILAYNSLEKETKWLSVATMDPGNCQKQY